MLDYLSNLYSQNMSGGTYTPFTSLDILNDNIGGGGTYTGAGNINVSPSTPVGNDIKLILSNVSLSKNQMTFNVQNQVYQEGSTVVIDSNTINDSLVIKPIVNDGFLIKNYFELKKTLVSDSILVNGVYEPIQVAGIRLITYNSDGTIQGTTDYSLPQTIELGFDLNTNIPVISLPLVTQNVSFISNYINADLLKELKIKLTTNGLIYSLDNLAVKNDVDITSDTFGDLTIDISGLNKFTPKNIRWQYANKFNSNSTFDVNDFNVIGSPSEAIIPANIFNNNIIVLIEVQPNIADYPTLILDSSILNANIFESIFASTTSTTQITIPFQLANADSVKVSTPYKQFNTALSAISQISSKLVLDLKQDFQNNEGTFKIILVPFSNFYGDGIPQTVIVNINKVPDTPIIDKIDYPTSIDIPIYSFGDTNFKITFESNLATNVLIYHSTEDDSHLFGNYNSKDSIILNYNSIKGFINNGILDLLLVPYNGSIKGEIERISISFNDPGFYVSTQNLKDELFKAISSQIKLNLSKPNYLNHLASFDIDDKQIVIANWDIDSTTFTKFKTDNLGNQVPDGQINRSAVLKLYEPLPTNINKNDIIWVSEIIALPILQSVLVTGTAADNCIPLRAANFNIDLDFVKGQSTGFDSYDNLILSGSTSSQQLVDKYLVENFIDVKGINIDYTNFSNFVKYSSAVERLANFRYKKELVEFYDWKIGELLPESTILPTVQIDITNYQSKKTTLLNGFDGWENYLTQSIFTGSLIVGGFNQNNNPVGYDSNSTNLYSTYLSNATAYDKDNINALKNNIPLHIVEDNGNLDFLLFLDMIGNYFDIIWAYIKGMSDQRKISETNIDGIEDKFLYQYLESFGWDAKNLNSNKQLWSYVFGLNDSGELNTYTTDEYLGDNTTKITPQQATNQVWRRIANNLPYLLKHKGSVRGINALLTCYGIASSNLSIIEFGGPNVDTVEDTPKFIYDSLTYNLVFDNTTASLYIPFIGVPKPQSIEFKIKFEEFADYGIIHSNGFTLDIVRDTAPANIANKYGFLKVNGISVDSSYPFYDGNYHSILINKNTNSVTIYAKTNDKDRIVQSGQWIKTIVGSNYENITNLSFTGFIGHLEEVRLWNTNLNESVFDAHVIMPEAINGNNIYSSTEDLLLRLDFERPQNLELTSSINNIAPKLDYTNNVTTSGFSVISTYPYNYEVLERQVSLVIPNSGVSRYYTNKVRLENQELVANLSPTKRATKKAFESSTKDSNRVGLFFSPNKDLDLDIAKSLGGESFDDFIGDPQFEYGYTNYPELDSLRNYYFERVGERNLYEFIRLIKFYDKSLFVNLREMLPARANVTTGLLIAPHLLERNRVNINRPKAEAESLEGIVKETQITDLVGAYEVLESELNLEDTISHISANNEDLDVTLDATQTYSFSADDLTHNVIINTDLGNVASADWETYGGEIDYRRISSSIQTEFDLLNAGQVVGMDNNYINYGFNTYFDNGYGKYYYEENGSFKSKQIRAFLVTRKSTIIQNVTTFYSIDATGLSLPANGGYILYTDLLGNEVTLAIDENILYNFYASEILYNGLIGCTLQNIIGSESNVATSSYAQELIIQESGSTANLVDGYNIIGAITASGYLPSHYIYKGEKHTGIQNLFFRGSKQTIDTTIDGKSPVETFVTNPTTLRVTAQGRSNNEPILEVD